MITSTIDQLLEKQKSVPVNTNEENVMSYAGLFSGVWGETSVEVETNIFNLHNEWEKVKIN